MKIQYKQNIKNYNADKVDDNLGWNVMVVKKKKVRKFNNAFSDDRS